MLLELKLLVHCGLPHNNTPQVSAAPLLRCCAGNVAATSVAGPGSAGTSTTTDGVTTTRGTGGRKLRAAAEGKDGIGAWPGA